ncbi:hypothetical protein DPMN_154228 [Dreissena polymorpha]|uniref:Uncharacterized protein n=1 Tax=Dreissena polymorpha TaxID=45954 RepID=A0A9D4FNU1_DREPO|nr:hypothetical protein DPMN_154228 [Dreissena polymorpha]
MRNKKGKTNLSQSPLRILGLVVLPATNPKCAGRRRGSLPSFCVTSTRRVKASASDNPRVVGMRARIEADKKASGRRGTCRRRTSGLTAGVCSADRRWRR